MIRLNKFVNDDGALLDVEDAQYLCDKKLQNDDPIDFSGVDKVSLEFLSALFKDIKTSSLLDRITGATGEVELTLMAWLDAQGAPTPAVRRVPKATSATSQAAQMGQTPQTGQTAKGPVPTIGITPLTFERPEPQGEKFTPTRLVHRLQVQLRQYIESAYPLNDPTLIKARRVLLETADGGHLLSQEPYVETTPRYKAFQGGFAALKSLSPSTTSFLTELSHTSMDVDTSRTLLFPGLYTHQARALEAFLGEKKNLVVATGTGSGKTECFLIPMVSSLWEEATQRPQSFEKRGVRALILYPMNALVNDQLSRLRLLVGSETLARRFREEGKARRHPTFGMYTGRTPYPGPRNRDKDQNRVKPLLDYYMSLPPELEHRFRELGRYPAKDLKAFLAEDRVETKVTKTGKNQTSHNWGQRLQTAVTDRELLTRQEMIATEGGASPDILITNYSMLEYMLMRPFERPIFEETRAWLQEPDSRFLLVLDEAHMYRGAKGAEVAFLIRRLMSRLGITDKPEKLAIICTSASLGNDDNAIEIAQRFAADLTGCTPGSFEIVTGEREKPTPVAPGSPELATVLAAVDLEALHADAGEARLQEALAPVFAHLGKPMETASEEALLQSLHAALKGQPFLNQVFSDSAGKAVALRELADNAFPKSPEARKALEVLLTLGTIARPSRDEAGLLPTRVHMMFRGLAGLYACMNPQCPDRQASGGEMAPVGKLFVESRTHCDACHSRVFELASCRDCGGAYVLAYSHVPTLDGLDFLWGETEGNLTPVHLLPTEPRHLEDVEEIQIQLSTGSLIKPNQHLEAHEKRALWLAYDGSEGVRQATFKHCALCQAPGSRKKSRILDFRTKGEQPFTALVEAQFSEQPPQKADPSLPNRGRKVLVFSDGRQKAARLAPALETSHTRDAFRQVLALAVRELEALGQPARLTNLYPALLKVCAKLGVDLYPSRDEVQFQHHLKQAKTTPLDRLLMISNQGSLQPPLSYAKSLFSELTDRFFSLPSIGMAVVQEDPVFDYLLETFPEVGLSNDEMRILFRNWLRVQFERRCFIAPGASPSALREDYDYPQGISRNKENDLLPGRFKDYLHAVLDSDESAERVVKWFTTLLDTELLRFQDDQFYLQPMGLVLKTRIHEPWLRCSSCNRLQPEGLQARCFDCLGDLVDASTDPLYLEARSGYYRSQVERAADDDALEPFGLSTAEHSAQLTGQDDEEAFTKTEKYELRFQDVRVDNETPIDVLSCTTTMEVGIDIGTLSGVALRNVPPHVANYQQRAGRAGRRGRSIASVVTYAHGGSHDAFYYSSPGEIISGAVRSPVVYVENLKVLERHVNAYLVQVFFHETVAANPSMYQLFESLGTVKDFLTDEQPISYQMLSRWLTLNATRLQAQLASWVPTYSHGSQEPIDVSEVIAQAIPRLVRCLEENLPLDLFRRQAELTLLETEALEQQLDENLLKTLVDRAILPRYAFPTDTVTFWVPKRRKPHDPKHKRQFEYQPQRDLQIALTEYAPGRSLTIDKIRFTSAALYSPYQPDVRQVLDKAKAYTACKECGYVSLNQEAPEVCPVCTSDKLFKKHFVTPEGFAPNINEERDFDRGGTVTYAGQSTPAKMEVQDVEDWDETHYQGRMLLSAKPRNLVVVNKGIGDRGFMVCPDCGLAEPQYGPGYTRTKMVGKAGTAKNHQNPVVERGICAQTPSGPYFMGHQFITDVLLLRLNLADPVVCPVSDTSTQSGRAGRMALSSLVEALCLAASRTLQIEEGELAGNWNPVLNAKSKQADLYLYDLLPGGAGYTQQVRDNLDSVLAEARRMLAACGCGSSCYRCLRHYGNQILHGALDRHLALVLLDHLTTGAVPQLEEEVRVQAIRPLTELLRLKGIRYTEKHPVSHNGQTVVVPLVIHSEKGVDTWVDVHHPLVNPELAMSEVLQAGESQLTPTLSLDAYTLRHDLPEAFQKVTAHAPLSTLV